MQLFLNVDEASHADFGVVYELKLLRPSCSTIRYAGLSLVVSP